MVMKKLSKNGTMDSAAQMNRIKDSLMSHSMKEMKLMLIWMDSIIQKNRMTLEVSLPLRTMYPVSMIANIQIFQMHGNQL